MQAVEGEVFRPVVWAGGGLEGGAEGGAGRLDHAGRPAWQLGGGSKLSLLSGKV